MTGPLQLCRCAICNSPRADGPRTPGLAALVGEDRVAWLCAACMATPGRSWRFIGAVRGCFPDATVVSTSATAGSLVLPPPVARPVAGAPRD